MYSFTIQAFSIKLGLLENFPTAVHHQSRLGAILAPLVRALEIATEKSSFDKNALQPSTPAPVTASGIFKRTLRLYICSIGCLKKKKRVKEAHSLFKWSNNFSLNCQSQRLYSGSIIDFFYSSLSKASKPT